MQNFVKQNDIKMRIFTPFCLNKTISITTAGTLFSHQGHPHLSSMQTQTCYDGQEVYMPDSQLPDKSPCGLSLSPMP